jgi:hypothetical protein
MSLIKTINEAKRLERILSALKHKISSSRSCIAGSTLGMIAIVVLIWLWRREIKKELEVSKGLDVDLGAVHKFYIKIQESPLLYPYFMHIKEEKREDVMQKISCSFHKALNQVVVAPEHLTKLKKIHNKLGVDEKAYAEFTKLFAHICCNKSDEQRGKMLKTFTKLQKYICTGVVNQANSMVAFFKLPGSGSNSKLYSSEFGQQMQTVTQIQGLVDIERWHDVWEERGSVEETVKDLYKQISELENTYAFLLKVNKSLDARMKVLESNHRALNVEH